MLASGRMSNNGGGDPNGGSDEGQLELRNLASELVNALESAGRLLDQGDPAGANAAFEAAIPLIDQAVAFPLTPKRSAHYAAMFATKVRLVRRLMPDRWLAELGKDERLLHEVLKYLETEEVADSQSDLHEFIGLKAELHLRVSEMALGRIVSGDPKADDISIAIHHGELSRQEFLEVGDGDHAAIAAATAGDALFRRLLRTSAVSTIAEAAPSLASVDDRIRAIGLLGEAWDQIRERLPVHQRIRIGIELASCYVSSSQISDMSRLDRVADIVEILSPLVDRNQANPHWFHIELLRSVLASERADFDEAIEAGLEALHLAKQMKIPEFKIEGSGFLGRACLRASQRELKAAAAGRLHRRGRRYLESAVREARATGSPSMHAGILLGAATFLFDNQFTLDIRHIESIQPLLEETEENPIIRTNQFQYFLAARMLGLVHAVQQRWEAAALYYTRASMIQQQVTSSSVAMASGMTAASFDVGFAEEFAYVFAQLKKPQYAIGVLESRSRLLRRRVLSALPPWFQTLIERDPQLTAELLAQLREIEDLQWTVKAGLVPKPTRTTPTVHEEAYDHYVAAIDRFRSLTQRVQSVLGSDANIMAPSDRQSDIVENLVPGEALVYYTLTILGEAAIVLRWMAGSIGLSVVTVWLGNQQHSKAIFPKFDTDTLGWQWSGESLYSAGQHYVEPLAAYLRQSGVRRVYIVPSALNMPMPLHCLTYDTDSGRRRLIDEFDVSFLPFGEAIVKGKASLQRTNCTNGTFIGIACIPDDPSFAEAEVRHASQLFRPAGRVVSREEATLGHCQELSRSALVFHIACHGGRVNNEETAAPCLKLADGPLTDVEILEGPTLESTRLVVLASCASGQLAFFRGPNESMSIANCYLTMGAAGAIATLQPVDDFVACAVLCRFYEEWVDKRDELYTVGSHAAALGQAQRWFSRASREDVLEYLRERPVLFQAYEGFVDKLPVTMEASVTRLVDNAEWAQFIALGC